MGTSRKEGRNLPPHPTPVVLERIKIEEKEEICQTIIKIKSIFKKIFFHPKYSRAISKIVN
jgi:hypothetical protein